MNRQNPRPDCDPDDMTDPTQDFNQQDFDAFRADPKRQAMVKRILDFDMPENEDEEAFRRDFRRPPRTIEPFIDSSGRRV